MKSYFILFAVLVFVLVLSIKGLAGNPDMSELVNQRWMQNGPFELSPERGRFALAYAVVEEKSFFFPTDLARFVTPDVGFFEGKYVSLFAPGVSIIILPGYIIGKILGASQLGTVAVISFFALLNTLLLYKISHKLGASCQASVLASLLFLLATPSFAYATTIYQHHISTFIILVSIAILLHAMINWQNITIILFLCAVSVIVDYPNFFLMLPIGIYALINLTEVTSRAGKIQVQIGKKYILSAIGLVIPIIMFGVYNWYNYGSPTTLSGTVPSVSVIDESGNPFELDASESGGRKKIEEDATSYSFLGLFKPRQMINGLYTHLLSPDRGMVVFTPIILVGIVGIYFMYKEKNRYLSLLLSIVLINLILYSMWGDPWGGWAFGSRYLIPSYAIMAIFLAIALTRLSKRSLFLFLVSILMIYSIAVNTLGAITTNANPPKIQAIPLQEISGKMERYSFDRNWEYLNTSGSKSFFYREYASGHISSQTYYFLLVSAISLTSLSYLWLGVYKNSK